MFWSEILPKSTKNVLFDTGERLDIETLNVKHIHMMREREKSIDC